MAGSLGIATLETDVELKGLDKGLKQAEGKSKSFFDKAKDGFSQKFGMSAADAAMAAARAIKQFADESIAEFQAFEKGAAEVFTLMPGMTTEAMDSMKADVLTFSAEVGRQTDETLPALYQAISAGVPQENVFDFMQIASDAALGGVTDLETAVDGITSVTNAYGSSVIDAARASDVMFTAVKLGKTDFSQLSSSLFNVIPTAASLGVSFEDVAASMAVLTAQGTPTSVATTQLRAALVEASKGGTKLDLALRDLTGKGFAGLSAEGKTSSEIFETLRQSMPEQQFKDLFGSVEALNAVLGITGPNAEKTAAALDEMGDAAGATAAAAETMGQTMEHLENRANAASEAYKIQTGGALAPLKKAYLNTKTSMFEFFTAQDKINQAVRDGNITLAEGQDLNRRLGMTSLDAAGALEELAAMQGEMTDETRDAAEAAASYDRVMTGMTGTTDEATLASAALAAEQAALTEEIQAAAMARSEATGVNQEFADKLGQTNNLLTDEEAALRASQAAANAANREHEAAVQALADKAAAEQAATEAAREHGRVLGGLFHDSLTATTEDTRSLSRTLYDEAVAAGAGAAELAILAQATGEFTEEQIEAAFKAAVMQEKIQAMAAAVAAGDMTVTDALSSIQEMQAGMEGVATATDTVTASEQALNDELTLARAVVDDNVEAYGRLQGANETAAESSHEITGAITGAQAAFTAAAGAANDAAAAINAIPDQKNITINVQTKGGMPQTPEFDPAGQTSTGDFFGQSGGFTGFGRDTELAGVVHRNETVVPAPILRAGPAAILDFVTDVTPSSALAQGQAAAGGGGGVGSGGSGGITIDLRHAVIMSQAQANQMIQQALDANGVRADIYLRTQ